MTQKLSYARSAAVLAGPGAGFRLRWLLWLALLAGGLSARAQWLTETNVIPAGPGWSAVYFYVDASGYGENIDQLVGNDPADPIDQIWLWKYPAGSAQYLTTPDSPYGSGGQWATWIRNNNETNTPNSLEELIPNSAYLVHSTANTNYAWKVQGQPVPPSYTWDMTGLNFIGFSTPFVNPPNFLNYFAQDPAIANVVQLYKYDGLAFSSYNPAPVYSEFGTLVTRGQAYWVSATNVNNTYFGPFTLTLPNPSGLNFGTSAGQFTLQLINITTNTLTVSVRLLPSETPPLGQTNIVAPPPLLLEGALNSANLTYAYTTLPAGVATSWTLAPAGQSGSDVQVVLGVNRFALTASAGALYAGFLQFTDSLGFSEVDVPVSANVANNTGLWVGSASISQVGSYLKSYATNSQGSYLYSTSTNFQLTTVPAPALVTSNVLIATTLLTNTTITYLATNLVAVSNYTQYVPLYTSNVFVLVTNLAVNYSDTTNVIIQTNITGFTLNSEDQLVLTTANTTNMLVTVVETGTNLTVVSNTVSLPVVEGNFLLAASPVVGSAPHCVVAATLSGTANWALICANTAASTLTVLTNQDGGSFVTSGTYAVGAAPNGVTAAHVNGTANWDLICANTTDSTLTVLTNNGSGGFAPSQTNAVGNGAYSVVAADVNGDGWVDLICANKNAATLTVLTNNRSGRFVTSGTYAVGNGPFSVVAADVNGDGWVDLICANKTDGTLTALTNNRSGGFVTSGTYTVGSAPRGVTAADVNGDGWVDMICANSTDNTLTVLTNNHSGHFVTSGTYAVGAAPYCVTAADVNGDGWVDLICANDSGNTLTVLTNNGSGGFVTSGTPAVGSTPYSVTAADVNGDGRVDLISANSGANTLTILTNYVSWPSNVNWPSNGLPVAVTSLVVTNDNTAGFLTEIGVDYGPVTNLVVDTDYSTTNFVAGFSPEQFVMVTNLSASTNFALTNLSALAAVMTAQTNTSSVISTNYYPMPLALLVFTNLVNGSSNWISYNVVTNAVYATNSVTTNYLTTTLEVASDYTIYAGVTNLSDIATNLQTTSSNLPVSVAGSAQAYLSLLLATNPAYVTATNPLVTATSSSYQVTAINTNLGPVVTPYPLRLILFNNGTNCCLLQRVFYGLGVGSNLVVATTQSALSVPNLNTARRITATAMPWTAANNPWPFVNLSGQTGLNGTLTATIFEPYDDQAANPFLHTYHPDHNNLTAITDPNVPPHELPKGSESYDITRVITLQIVPNTADFISLTTASSSLAGSYLETITLTGLNNAPRSFTTAGNFTLVRLSPIATLTTQ